MATRTMATVHRGTASGSKVQGSGQRQTALMGASRGLPAALLHLQQTVGNRAATHQIQRTASGQPMDTPTRTLMESRFGRDFGAVRIHTDNDAARRAAALGALAYTIGHDIHFAAGSYEPASERGRHLLAHELAHVAQGDGATASAGGQSSTVTSLEHEARFAAHTVQQGGMVPPIRGLAHDQTVPLRDDLGTPTFGNLTDRAPEPGHRVELRQIGGRWYEINPENNRRTIATHRYNFVLQDGRTYGSRYGHLEAASGRRVTFAGQMVFSQPGQLDHWNAGPEASSPRRPSPDRPACRWPSSACFLRLLQTCWAAGPNPRRSSYPCSSQGPGSGARRIRAARDGSSSPDDDAPGGPTQSVGRGACV